MSPLTSRPWLRPGRPRRVVPPEGGLCVTLATPGREQFPRQMKAAESVIRRYCKTLRELAMKEPQWVLWEMVLALQERLLAEFSTQTPTPP